MEKSVEVIGEVRDASSAEQGVADSVQDICMQELCVILDTRAQSLKARTVAMRTTVRPEKGRAPLQGLFVDDEIGDAVTTSASKLEHPSIDDELIAEEDLMRDRKSVV